MSRGAEMIAAERQRQMDVEGWTPDHDAEHGACEMAMAAVAYAIQAIDDTNGVHCTPPAVAWWPWESVWFKPTDPIRSLVKAGALIAAEIDRLLNEDGAA